MKSTSSSSPFEKQFGFSRAVRHGDRILVSGTGPVEPDGSSTPGDAAAQAARCFDIIIAAVADLGGRREDIVRTRILVTDVADGAAIGVVHGRYFADIRPAATMVVIAGLVRPEWRVETEAEAIVYPYD